MKIARRGYTAHINFRLSRFAVAAALVLAGAINLSSTPGAAQDVAVSAFHGHWQGSGVSESEVSINFRMTARDLDVVMAPTGDGFSVAWTTVQRQKGDPNNPNVVRKGSEIVFQPSGRAGVWHEVQSASARAGDRYAWSRIEDNTLITQIIEVDNEGHSDHHVYRRTL